MDGSYIFTEHLIKRLKERFPHLELPWDDRWQLYKDLDRMIRNSYEERRYLNDTAFVFHLHETYGYDARYEFLVNEENNILFVVSLNHGTRKIVKTCMQLNTCRKFTPKKKFQAGPVKPQNGGKKRRGSPINEVEAQEEYVSNADDSLLPATVNIDDLLKPPRLWNQSYKLIISKQTGKPHAIKCMACKSVSYNEEDIAKKYCSFCKIFHEQRNDVFVK